MKSLLVHGEERPVLNHERTNPNQLVFDNNRLSAEIPPLENQNLSSKDRAHKRWRRATRYAIRIFHVQQAATDDLEERLRHVRMGQKRKLRERQEEREKRVFSDILKHLTDLDKKLQQIVDSVRPPKEEKRKDITKLQPNAETGSIAIELRRMPRLAEENGRLPVAHTIESERQRSLSDRAAEKIKALGPTSWKTKYKIAYKWMRQRDRATELKHERDILWNRVHASQLSLLGRLVYHLNEEYGSAYRVLGVLMIKMRFWINWSCTLGNREGRYIGSLEWQIMDIIRGGRE